MCKCKNIEIGSYDNQTGLYIPKKGHILSQYIDNRNKEGLNIERVIFVDTCLVQEIAELWQLWIKTTGCCCGHNKKTKEAFIWVADENIPKMKELGYLVQYNPNRPGDEDSFIPNTKL